MPAECKETMSGTLRIVILLREISAVIYLIVSCYFNTAYSVNQINILSYGFWQSFQHKNSWMPEDASCLAEKNRRYENSSRTEPKRGHQWFMSTGEPEVFSNNKKQAVEAVSGSPIPGVPHVNISSWDTNSGFHSVTGQLSDRLFGSELRAVNLVDKNMASVGSGNLNMGRKDFENQYGNNPSMGLSMSHTIRDPSSRLNFGGIRKVKVNQVRDSDNCMSSYMGNSCGRTGNSTIPTGVGYSKNDGSISLGPTYNNGNDNTISTETTLSKANDNHVSMAHTFNKGDGNFMLMGHNYGKGDESILSRSQPFDRGNGNYIPMGQSHEKEDSNMISLGTSYNKGHGNFISMGPTYSKSGEKFITMAASYDKGTDHVMSIGPTYDKVDSNIAPTVPSYDKGDSGSLPMGHNHDMGEGSTTSFGGFRDDPESNPSGGMISGYDLLMGNQTSDQGLNGQKTQTESNSVLPVNSTSKSNLKTDAIPENIEPKITKKATTNNFPLNVKSLLSTGIFDGVPVKYVSMSREVNCLLLSCFISGCHFL